MTTSLDGFEAVTLAATNGVAWVTLNRPEAANSRNQTMRDELGRVYDWIESNNEIRAMILTGAGDRFFCAGMDLKESGRHEPQLDRRQRLRHGRDIERLATLPVPTIAAINGYAVGGGLEMAMACDLRIAAPHAEVGLPELKHGLIPGGGGSQRLPRLVGYARALELILLGDRLTADKAAEMGLITQVATSDGLERAAAELAARVAVHSRVVVRAAKEALRASLELPLSQGIDRELDLLLFLLQHRIETPRTEERT